MIITYADSLILLAFGTDTMGDCDLDVCGGNVYAVVMACSGAMARGAESARIVEEQEARDLLAHFDEYDLHVDDHVRAHIEALP